MDWLSIAAQGGGDGDGYWQDPDYDDLHHWISFDNAPWTNSSGYWFDDSGNDNVFAMIDAGTNQFPVQSDEHSRHDPQAV